MKNRYLQLVTLLLFMTSSSYAQQQLGNYGKTKIGPHSMENRIHHSTFSTRTAMTKGTVKNVVFSTVPTVEMKRAIVYNVAVSFEGRK